MTYLDKILAHKKEEVQHSKNMIKVPALQVVPFFKRTCFKLTDSLIQHKSLPIIAEFKRKSPSKGMINENADVKETTLQYQENGAAALSVLTDKEFFNGSLQDIVNIRESVHLPVLRKDFIIDEYQVYEAKAFGADVILLIAAALTPEQTITFASRARELGMQVLLEVHNEEELQQHVLDQSGADAVDVIGVNNRNLTTFDVTLETSEHLAKLIPGEMLKISESGISNTEAIETLQQAGYQGFLIGEYFMKDPDPGQAFKTFYNSVFEKLKV